MLRAALAAASVLTITTATGCSLIGGGDEGDSADRVVLVTHESFALPDELVEQWEQDSGYQLEIDKVGDGGTLVSELVLTQDDPIGDVAFGVDNTYASRALDADVFEPADVSMPAGVDAYRLPGDDEQALTPVDNGNVCVNIDNAWFAAKDIAPPKTLVDLTKATYRDLFVTPGAATSTPGLAFLLATIAEFGDGWQDYWRDLMANGAKVTKGWEDAYQVDFTQGGGKGARPIVLSYDSSPAFTVSGGKSSTSALLDTCFQQVEYAGLLTGAANPQGAQVLLEFLVGPEVQAALPESMYVFPVDAEVELPAEWASYAKQPDAPLQVDPAEITANRETWLRQWSDLTTG